MRRKIAEETILFVSVLKWVFLSSLIGAIIGIVTALFLKGLNVVVAFTAGFKYYFLFLPAGFILSALIIKKFAPDAEGHGTEKVIEAVHKKAGLIDAAVVPIKLISTYITLAVGGSVGKEGPCAQIGAGVASLFAQLARFNPADRKKLVICGISAGFAAVFGTPVAGAIFGVEVLFVGAILYDVLLPSFVAGITAYYTSSMTGITYFYKQISIFPHISEKFFLEAALAGIFFGACSALLIEMLKLFKKIYDSLKESLFVKNALGGLILILLTLITSGRYLGLGLTGIQDALGGGDVAWYDFLMKTFFTSVSLNFGGSGGIVTPIFFIGSTAGSVLATLFGLDRAVFAAIGMVSVLAGAANTPIAASVMAIELFGPNIAPYAAISCVISFLITGHRSVYPSQILAISKSPSIHVETGKEIDDVKIKTEPREGGLIKTMRRLVRRIT